MHTSRSIQELGCITQATLFNVCLTEADLRKLNAWDGSPNRLGFSSAVWCRAFVHKGCRQDPERAREVTDLLDLQYMDTVVLVRCMEPETLVELVDLWVERPKGRALPGLLWALCTDQRAEVNALGARLCHEAATIAFETFVHAAD